MSAPSLLIAFADHGPQAVTEARAELQEAAMRLAEAAAELAKLEAHAALAKAMNGEEK